MVKRLTMLLLLVLTIGVFAQPATSFPAMKGIVSDYAGRLDEAQIKELSALLKDYERQTSIEFVVVVVNSLDGLSARNYATGIGDSWKIGKAGRNNGIVLLWAPNERAYALRVAEGLSADLPDAEATQITRQSLLPNFKRGDYYAGLKETLLATMEHVGVISWEERLEARKPDAEQETIDRKRRAAEAWQAEVQRRQEETRQAEQQRNLQSDTRTGLVFLTLVALGGLLAVVIHRARRRAAKLAELAQSVTTISDNLSAAEKNVPAIQGILDDCAREMPEQDISSLRQSLSGQPDRILKIKVDAQCIEPAKLESYDEMVRVRTNSLTERNLLESTKESIAAIKEAKAQSQAMMEKLSRETFEITDVRDSSRTAQINELLLQSRQDYERARQNSSLSLVDWLIINQMLNNSRNQMQQAVSYSQEAPYAPSFYTQDDDSSSSRRSSSSWSSSSSSSSGGFFSSGDSGGGGGSFSSGSGSDGTY